MAEAPAAPALDSARSNIRAYFRIEQVVLGKLMACYGEKRLVTHHRLRQTSYDAVLLSDREAVLDVIFEVKVWRPGATKNVQNVMERLVLQILTYQRTTGRKACTAAMFVTRADVIDDPELDRYRQRISEFARLHEVNIHTLFLTEKELVAMSCEELNDKLRVRSESG